MRLPLSASIIFFMAMQFLGHSNVFAKIERPIVIVFDIEAKAGAITAEEIDQLTNYLSGRMAEGNVFQVIPRTQLKERLTSQKKDSYQACYDQKCQLDIGRELAAEKSLATEILKVGSQCAIVTMLYDLKLAVTDRSSTVKGGCSQDELVASLETVVAKIKGVDNAQQLGVKASPVEKEKVESQEPSPKPLVFSPPPVAETTSQLAASSVSKDNEETTALHRRKTIRAWIGLGAAIALAGGAGVAYGLGFSKGNDAHDPYLAARDQKVIDQYRETIDSAKNHLLVGHILMGVAAASLGYSLYEFFTRPDLSSHRTAKLSPGPMFSISPVYHGLTVGVGHQY